MLKQTYIEYFNIDNEINHHGTSIEVISDKLLNTEPKQKKKKSKVGERKKTLICKPEACHIKNVHLGW